MKEVKFTIMANMFVEVFKSTVKLLSIFTIKRLNLIRKRKDHENEHLDPWKVLREDDP